jgi:phospholipid/cholesterol/gamma-HCH transport system permease protein
MPFVSPDVFFKERVAAVQEYSLLTGRAVANIFTRPRYWDDIFTQMDSIGAGSMPIVILTGFFTGCVLALQSATSLQEFGAVSMTGNLVALSMVRELGPVLTGLMISGRNASGMASELGSMKVTEQIDAMRALGTDPVRKLVTPRLVATVIMMFFLTIISDVVQGLTKPLFSGFIIATIGCYYGLNTKGGTQGVGRSTTQAVVASSVLIIVFDFILSRAMLFAFGQG